MKDKIKYIVAYIILFFLLFFELPYYIDAPGGLDNLNNRVEVENAYKAKGTINLTYVKEIKATPITSLIALINPNWKLEPKNTDDNGTLDYDEMMIRQQILNKQSYTSGIKFAYEAADKEVTIDEEYCYIIYLFEEADTDLKVGDQLKKFDGKEINKCSDLRKYIDEKQSGEEYEVEVLDGDKEKVRKVKLVDIEGTPMIGVQMATVYSLTTEPKYKFKFNSSEYGPSGGLMISLAVYNSLVETDITGGKTIAGTGTLEPDGTVGEIGGIEYKIKGAVKKKADIFFVPAGENYEDAKKLIEKNHYKIELVKVETFDDALNYLLDNVVKK